MTTKKKPSGLAAKLIRETPRVYTGDLSENKALKSYRRGEIAFDNRTAVKHDPTELFKEVSAKFAARKEKVAELEKKRIETLSWSDKIKVWINKFLKKLFRKYKKA